MAQTKDLSSHFSTFEKILAEPLSETPAWIGPGVLPKQGKLLLGGEAKIGKSFLALQLAKDLALGRAPFGHPTLFVHGSPRVLLIEKEVGYEGMKVRIHHMFRECETLLGTRIGLFTCRNFKLDRFNPDLMNLKNLLDTIQPNILIVDPASKLMTGDDSSNADVNHFFDAIDHLLEEYKSLDMSVIVTHHYGKPHKDQVDRLNSYNFRGASKWKDDPDTLVTCVREEIPGSKSWNLNTRWLTRHHSQIQGCQLRVHVKEGNLPEVREVKFHRHIEDEENQQQPKQESKLSSTLFRSSKQLNFSDVEGHLGLHKPRMAA